MRSGHGPLIAIGWDVLQRRQLSALRISELRFDSDPPVCWAIEMRLGAFRNPQQRDNASEALARFSRMLLGFRSFTRRLLRAGESVELARTRHNNSASCGDSNSLAAGMNQYCSFKCAIIF
jgi:hypothetical protein